MKCVGLRCAGHRSFMNQEFCKLNGLKVYPQLGYVLDQRKTPPSNKSISQPGFGDN